MKAKNPKLTKIYYTMGEVAEMFDVNTTLIRFWESKFDVLKPHRNKKGNRLFTPEDVETLKLIYHLVKEKGMTLAGAQKRIKENREGVEHSLEIIEKLQNIKAMLLEIKQEMKGGDSDDEVIVVDDSYGEPLSADAYEEQNVEEMASPESDIEDEDEVNTAYESESMLEDEPVAGDGNNDTYLSAESDRREMPLDEEEGRISGMAFEMNGQTVPDETNEQTVKYAVEEEAIISTSEEEGLSAESFDDLKSYDADGEEASQPLDAAEEDKTQKSDNDSGNAEDLVAEDPAGTDEMVSGVQITTEDEEVVEIRRPEIVEQTLF